MSALESFNSAMTATLAEGNVYKLSGVCDIAGLGMAIIFSASIYPIDINATVPSPMEATRIFQRIHVDGFIFSKAEIINFLSSTVMPGPNWRIQVRYFKEPNVESLSIK